MAKSSNMRDSVTLTIHRAANEIGGNCIEIAAKSERILLDAGRPLDVSGDEPCGIIPRTLNMGLPMAGVLLSHAHQDHYGLLGELPDSWPVYCGKASELLIRLTSKVFDKAPAQQFRNWESGVPLVLGRFRITPFLTDHSAFDAYMLLIEVEGCRFLYSGDFRIHGRKASLVKRMMDSPPPAIDALIMEGTNLGSDKPCCSEEELEERFIDLFKGTTGRVTYYGLPHIEQTEKDEMRALAMADKPNSDYTKDERAALIEYCWSDVVGLRNLLPRLEDFLCCP